MTAPRAPRVVGVDLSLTSTGLADSCGRTQRVRTKSCDGVPATVRRLATISREVHSFATMTAGEDGVDGPRYAADLADLVVIEGPSFASTSGQQHTRGGLWWAVVDALHWADLPILVIPPTTLKKYATGSGSAGKDAVLAAAIKRYPQWDISGNDVADAVVLACIGARLLGRPVENSMPKAHHLELGTVADNNRDRDERGRHHPLPGSSNGYSKLTEDDVLAIRERLAAGESQRSIGRAFNVSQFAIWRIASGRGWASGPVDDLPKTHLRALAKVALPTT
jgi:crossover junction endodeoxyribonuclease RuvC